MEDYNIEKTLYQAPHLLPSIWRRLYSAENRFYFPAMGDIEILAGITTILDKALPTPKQMKDWLIVNKWEGLQLRANYGTAVHAAIAEWLLGNPKWFDSVPDQHKSKVWNAVIAFANTIRKYKIVKLLLVETPVKGCIEGCDYVTTVDLCAEFEVPHMVTIEIDEPTGETYKSGAKKGQFKTKKVKKTETEIRIETWILDTKSNYDEKEKGEKSYYDTNLFQLLAQKEAIFQTYGIVVDRVFNWSELPFLTDNDDNTYQLTEWVLDGVQERIKGWSHKGYSHKKINTFRKYMSIALDEGHNKPSGKLKAKSFIVDEYGRTCPTTSIITYREFVEDWRKQKENKEIEEEMDSTDTHRLLFIRSTYPEYVSMRAEYYANNDEEWILKGYVRDMPQADIDRLIGEQEEDCANQEIIFRARKDWFLLVKSL